MGAVLDGIFAPRMWKSVDTSTVEQFRHLFISLPAISETDGFGGPAVGCLGKLSLYFVRFSTSKLSKADTKNRLVPQRNQLFRTALQNDRAVNLQIHQGFQQHVRIPDTMPRMAFSCCEPPTPGQCLRSAADFNPSQLVRRKTSLYLGRRAQTSSRGRYSRDERWIWSHELWKKGQNG